MSLFDLSGQTAVVLAGTSTLGRAMAAGLARHGAAVAITGRELAAADEVCATIAAAGATARAFAADAMSRDDLQAVLAGVLRWRGRVDVLLSCPGRNSTTPFFDLELAEWREIMAVNTESVVLAAQVFGRQMVEAGRGGSIINVSSVSAQTPLSRVPVYSASKAALENITRFLARELAPHRVRVNAIVPGFFPAPQNRAVLSPDRVEAIMRHTPLGRFGDAEELQGAAVWLASAKASSFVTGALIAVDGGFGAMTI